MSNRKYGIPVAWTLVASVLVFPATVLFAKWPGQDTPVEDDEAPGWVSINGNVRLADGTATCAMVLANGQHMFSCDGFGSYGLDVPLDDLGQVTLFVFADGFAPFQFTAIPADLPAVVYMQTAPPNSPLISMTREMACAGNAWVRVWGEIESSGADPLCAMVLANGQNMFTCDESHGLYDQTVPVDEAGNIAVFGFADGFQPYSESFVVTQCTNSSFPSCMDISGNWFAEESVTLSCSYLGEIETESQSGSGWTFITQNGCNFSYGAIGADITRNGTIAGNWVTVKGPLAYELDSGVTLIHNSATANGTAKSNTINLNGTGSVSGTFEGYTFNCTATSTATFTR